METFNANLRNHALAEFEKFANLEDNPNAEAVQEMMTDGMLLLMEDKDVLISHIEASKENVD